jgi:hypothetical protein
MTSGISPSFSGTKFFFHLGRIACSGKEALRGLFAAGVKLAVLGKLREGPFALFGGNAYRGLCGHGLRFRIPIGGRGMDSPDVSGSSN